MAYRDLEKKKAYQKAWRETHKEEKKAQNKVYREAHKEEMKAYQKAWYEVNKDERKAYMKAYLEANKDERKAYLEANKEKRKAYIKDYHKNHKEEIKAYIKAYKKKRLKNDQLYAFKYSVRKLTAKAFIRRGFKKNGRTEKLLGCSFEYLMKYLNPPKDFFTNRSNYHIDHIIPLETAKTEEAVIRLSHHTNLQILTAEENRTKSDKTLNTLIDLIVY